MSDDLLVLIVISTISSLMALIGLLFSASVGRRVMHREKYRRLDALRQTYRDELSRTLSDGATDPAADLLPLRPGSLKWQALEDVLLRFMDDERRRHAAQPLFGRLGYVAYYEGKLSSRNLITAASAVDRLGRMRSAASVDKLIARLEDRSEEIVAVAVRSLSRIGAAAGLRAIVDRLPALLGSGRVAAKALETSILNFGPPVVPVLIERHGETPDPLVAAFVLGVLSSFPVDTRSLFLAIENLNNADPEVRSRALRVLSRAETNIPHLPAQIVPLLGDPVWFVRLQAAKAVAALGCEEAAKPLGRLLFDPHWMVRGEAARTLTGLGDCAVEAFLDALTTDDDYAKESVCEEIERAGLTLLLIKNLGGAGPRGAKSRAILKIMRERGFSSSLAGYLHAARDERARQGVREILAGEQEP
jgi:HEAT repeat protein